MAESKETVQIRAYTQADFQGVRRNLEEGEIFYEPMDQEKRLSEKVRKNPGSILVAVDGEQVVGNVFLVEDGWAVFAYRLAVRKNYRGRGIGTKLMNAVEDAAKKLGYETLEVLVEEDNPELQDYYKGLGYEKGNRYRWMEKDLTKA